MTSLACIGWRAGPAHAQPPSAALFATAGSLPNARELDTRIRRALEELGAVQLKPTQKLDLAATQLALDCVDESVKCLQAVAQKTQVELLIAPSLERGNDELTLTLLAFDARGTGMLTRVVRWQAGSQLTPDTLAAIPELVRGLLPVVSPAPVPRDQNLAAPRPQTSAAGQAVASDSGPRGAFPLRPAATLAGGLTLLAAGVVTGVIMHGAEHDYANMTVHTREQAQEAQHTRSLAHTEATVANVFYGLGAIATVIGGTWLTLTLLRAPSRERAQLVPAIGPTQVGMLFGQRGDFL